MTGEKCEGQKLEGVPTLFLMNLSSVLMEKPLNISDFFLYFIIFSFLYLALDIVFRKVLHFMTFACKVYNGVAGS
jgi:hypothetical protein